MKYVRQKTGKKKISSNKKSRVYFPVSKELVRILCLIIMGLSVLWSLIIAMSLIVGID